MLKTFIHFFVTASAAFFACAAAMEQPNILFFLVDDLGWTDSSVYGSTFYRTPAMERLAKSSVRFTNAYSASPLCSPSRASIISGQVPARHGMTTAWGHTAIKPDEPDYDLERGAIYSFFPHNFSERSPPGCWIREGDWKLTEVFYVSDLHPEKHILTCLKDDVGETTNLATQYPERVARMAEKLKQHYMTLCDRPPKPNPNFDPSKLPVAGWVGAVRSDPQPVLDDGLLRVDGKGISTRGLPCETGAMTLRVSLLTDRKGPVRFFWSDRSDWAFYAERSADVNLAPGEGFQALETSFETADELIGLRMDFNGGNKPG